MALDGITVANIVNELKIKLLGGRIDKLSQPENDEIIIPVRSLGNNYKLLLTANSSHPRIHLTGQSKSNPMTAPLFCMVLRKHLNGGKILSIEQPNFERIVEISVESMNEMGDLSVKKLIIEIMGKHSNIILINENHIILDSIKHISHDTSSVREVLPGKTYVYPPAQDKLNPLELEKNSFFETIYNKKNERVQGAIYKSYSGISPIMAGEIMNRAGLSADMHMEQATDSQLNSIYLAFEKIRQDILNHDFTNEVFFEKGKIIEYSSMSMTVYDHMQKKYFESISELIEFFYAEKDNFVRINQKSYDLKKLIDANYERCVKKRDIQQKTLKNIANRNDLKIKGELLTANIYELSKGMTSYTALNFYEEAMGEIVIMLDANLTPSENAQRYFKKYNKEKRTFAALQDQIVQNDEELAYFDSLLASLLSCSDEADIEEIRAELVQQGYSKKRKVIKGGQKPKKSKPLKFMSSDGFEIYVGKNNNQNDELTLHFAEPNDIWLHTKDIPGSHVIIKTNGQEAPDSTLDEAAQLAAFYSKARAGSHVPVDYVTKRNVKKPNGSKPGFVIYEKNKTAYVTPDEVKIKNMMSL